jgi:hypothetical protein
MPETVYLLCAATSFLCAALLAASYRRRRTGLLLWSMLCFVGLALNNVLLVVDLMIATQVDLSLLRSSIALVAMVLLVVGLIWESR